MTLKKVKIINVVFLFCLSFFWHFGYKLFSNDLFAMFFPVNESIWEHMKIIFYVSLLGSVLQNLLCHKYNIEINNKYIEMMVKPLLGVVIYLLVFIPVYLNLGENIIFSIGLMLLVYILMEFIGYKILLSHELHIKILPIIILILSFILLSLLTFFPPYNFLFFDSVKLGYGVIK